MAEMRKRTSMSVPEMGRMLGLGKTESYWLIKKDYFKTILVGNTMRVMIDSFEEWYANQFKYLKVDGTPPGEELKKTTYSMEELGQRLGLKEATAYELVAKGHFDVVDVLGKRRVTKESFERWYASQTDYRTVEDQELDADIMASTYGLPEIARMLDTNRQNRPACARKYEISSCGVVSRKVSLMIVSSMSSISSFSATSLAYVPPS